MSFRARLQAAISASVVAVAVRIFVTFVQVPVLLTFWTRETYGAWVAMMAALAYISLMDLGLSTTTMLQSAKAFEAEDFRMLRSTIKTSFSYCFCIVLVVMAMGLCLAPALTRTIGNFGGSDGYKIMLLFFTYGAATLLTSICIGALRGCGKYSETLLLESGIQLFEIALLFLAVRLLREPVYCIGALLLARVISIAVCLWLVLRICGPGLSKASLDRGLWREWLRSGAPATTIPFGTATFLQGFTFVVASFLGPSNAAYFSTLRAFTSFPERFNNLVNGLFTAEIAGDAQPGRSRFARLFQIGVGLVAILYGGSLLLYLLAGEPLFRLWTRGKLQIDWTLLGLLLASSFLRSFWNMNYALLLGVARHRGVTAFFLGLSMLSLILAVAFGSNLSLREIGAALLVVDALMTFVSLRSAIQFAETSFPALTGQIIRVMRARLPRRKRFSAETRL